MQIRIHKRRYVKRTWLGGHKLVKTVNTLEYFDGEKWLPLPIFKDTVVV
jgi:hypothetical protein